jgi:monooxygenase
MHRDVLIIGAGLSGVGAAWRLQAQCPQRSFAILEARDQVGGTWDLFRYPGVRSDSDMATLGYPFRPWTGNPGLADGSRIREYIAATAAEGGILPHIQFRTRVESVTWSSSNARWTVHARVGAGGEPRTFTCSVLHVCAGYYDYDNPHRPHFEGEQDFAGAIVHPQMWPRDLDVTGRRVVVVGSGATAITLVPELAASAASVTMLQRSATYVASLPTTDRLGEALRRRLPERAAYRVVRARNLALSQAFYQLCRRRPALARRMLRKGLEQYIDDRELLDAQFTPTYEPWDQRLCAMPDGDFLRAVADGAATVVTDHIARFERDGIRLASGGLLEADVVVMATGLTLLPLGGLHIVVDEETVDPATRFAYRGLMLSGVPNLLFAVGYTNASWTLRADLVSRYLCRLLNHMRDHDLASVTPIEPTDVATRPLLDLSAGYIQRAAHLFPHQGSRNPWTVGQNYLVDFWRIPHADLTKDMREVGVERRCAD